MFKIDFRVEQISKTSAVIHRRILTPFFYINLKKLKAEFKEDKALVLMHQIGGFGEKYCERLPKGQSFCSGLWNIGGRYLKELNLIAEEYRKIEVC